VNTDNLATTWGGDSEPFFLEMKCFSQNKKGGGGGLTAEEKTNPHKGLGKRKRNLKLKKGCDAPGGDRIGALHQQPSKQNVTLLKRHGLEMRKGDFRAHNLLCGNLGSPFAHAKKGKGPFNPH